MKKSRYWFRPLLTGLILALLLARSAESATITVKSNADAGGTCPGATCTLRQAIATAAAGDTIDFYPGFATVDLTSAELKITKNLTIIGPGANLLQVRRTAAANFRIFNVVGNTVAISGVTISNGNVPTDAGGGILNDSGTVSLTNCAITGNSANGTGGFGGGIVNSTTASGSRMTITNCTISGNLGSNAGGISNGTSTGNDSGAMMTISNSTISGNVAGCACGGGGGILNLGTATIINSTISGNSAAGTDGGGINVFSGTVTARNTIIALNTAKSGPDIFGAMTSNGYNFIGDNSGANVAPKFGDQIGTAGAPINPMLGPLQDNGGPTRTQALLSGSTAIEGGNSSGSGSNTDQRGFARPVDSPSLANVGDGSDIGAYEVQADVLPGCSSINRVVKNNNDSGTDSLRGVIASVCAGSVITFAPNVTGSIDLTSAELLVNKSLTITGPGANVLTVERSAAAGTPDFRIFNIASNLNVTISGLTIAGGNASSSFGGGISNNATLTLANDTISGNSAAFGGGGVASAGPLTLTNCTIFANSGGTGGSGIANNSTLTISGSTISGNTANGGNGGGISNNGTTTLRNSTIAGNSASGAGGGVHNFNGTVTVRNSIIALNTAPSAPDFNNALTSQGFNLIGNSSGAAISPAQLTDQVGTAGSPVDPLLGSLQDNGGPTFTRALLAGSPATDKGDSGGLTTDQRGFPRPVDLVNVANATGGDGSDTGAFEVQASTLANVSTRLPVQTADNVLFAGVIVTGSQDKRVIVLAIGPSLTGFGVAGALADPILELYQGDTLLESNDNWIDSANKQAIIDSGLAPTNDLESAIVRTLPANSSQYTAIVRGVSNGTGIGVLQVYDLDATANSTLANISTRGLVQTGDNVLIAGTIVLGQTPKKVLVEALGPSVPVPGNLADPTLELRDVNGTLVDANDNWGDSSNKQAIIDTTIPPTNDLESAIVATLPANGAQYTAIVRGVNGAAGVAVVEVFALN